MDLSRRSVVVGLGLLATGSGAAFTSAAFNDSTNSNGDIRVVAGDGLVVEAGNAFNSDGTVNQTDPSTTYNYTDRFTENKSREGLLIIFRLSDKIDKSVSRSQKSSSSSFHAALTAASHDPNRLM